MKCPKCQAENPDERKFCRECGTKLLLVCPQCGSENLPGDKFCGECGQRLEEVVEEEKAAPEAEGERKHVTVLFSDLSGYTAMTERLDPEEVKEIMSRIFGEIAQVVAKYEGFIEKFVGDAVMALFGVPKTHEDDPVRAIRAAREIHDLVKTKSPEMEKKVGQALSMHTGINTGLVVTGEVDMEKGTHGVAGDTINLAARLSSLSGPDQIVVGPATHSQAQRFFTFEPLGPSKVKGKAEPIEIYKVLSPKEKPSKTHRPLGLRANLIGRTKEMGQLEEAAESLHKGKGSIISIYGEAGTGKSRLVEELRAASDLQKIQWQDGHAYAYSQNIPYFPLIDLLSRAFQIEENDPSEKIREKVESGVEDLVGKREDLILYVGGLFSLSYPEEEDVSPEFWRARLHDAIRVIFSAMARRTPTVICFEDLHWSDPSFLELLRSTLLESTDPVLFLCTYRPPFNLFAGREPTALTKPYHEIRLQDLSPSETQNMVGSLLKTESVPTELRQFIEKTVEGNPFYLEEVINNLIDSETLSRDNGGWKLTRPIGESEIPSTIHGVISARLDRLEKETKRILQEASVIGRAFLYDILERVADLKDRIDRCLNGLEQLDLIRVRSLEPDLQYIFKHALTQEVAYNGLLKRERQEIHERIALVIEQLFHYRLPEFYETLAFHFKQGKSTLKAIDYLMKSGEKSLGRYAVEEAHQYYNEAYDILTNKPDKTKEEEDLLINLLIKWALVFYYRGDFKGLTDLLRAHEALAQALDDKARLGIFYAWLGFALWGREEIRGSYQYLRKALELGEEIDDKQVIGYACAWITYSCAELGSLEEAINFGERAQEVARLLQSDQYLFFKSLDGMATTYFYRGESKKISEIGRTLLDYDRSRSNIRCVGMGHVHMGHSYLTAGNFSSAIECYQRAIEVSADPLYSQFPRFLLGISYVFNGQFLEAEDVLKAVESFSQNYGTEVYGTPAHSLLGVVLIAKGHMARGLKMIEDMGQSSLETERKYCYATTEYMLGKVYFQLVEGAGPISLSTMAKNIGFLIKNVPFASKKAEAHFKKAIEVAKEIGAKGVLGQAYLDLGLLHRAKGRTDQARKCILDAIQLFEQCEVEVFLKQAKEALGSLE